MQETVQIYYGGSSPSSLEALTGTPLVNSVVPEAFVSCGKSPNKHED